MASPEGKKGTLQSSSSSSSSDQQRQSSNNNNNGTSPHHNSPSTTAAAAAVSLIKTPVIRHRDADARVTIRGWLYKQGSDGLQLWKKRWFVLSQFCLFYYHGPEEEKVLGSLLLPSYTIRPCLVGDRDRVYRKYAFKAEHRNTRSFYLAAETRQSMIQWMNALSLAAILQDPESASASPSSSSSTTNAAAINSNNRNRSFDDSATSNGDQQRQQQQLQHPSTTATGVGGQRQPLYANAPPKPRRLNTSRDSPSCSSSPDRSPEQSSAAASSLSLVSSPSTTATPTSSGVMYGNQATTMMMQQQQQQQPTATNGLHPVWPPYQQRLREQHQQQQRRPVSAEVSALILQQQQQHQQRMRSSPQMQIPAERRTPDAYGRFKTEYEDVYNNSSTASSSNASSSIPQATTTKTLTTPVLKGTKSPAAAALVVTHRSEVARRVPPRPHSVDILQQQQHLQQQQQRNHNDYWASEENYAQQVRQSSVLRNFPSPLASASASAVVRDPAEISRDVKESALWSYVQSGQSNQQQQHQMTTTPVRPVLKKILSNSQENLLTTDDGDDQLQQQLFKRSASARLPRPIKQSPPPPPPLLPHQQNSETLNSSLSSSTTDNQPDMDNRRHDQREESMKRLLEWKQRMLQSPLTRKGGGGSGGGSGTRSSERSTPTQMLASAGSERDASSPMQHRQLQLQPHHISSSSPAIPSPVLPVQQQQSNPSGGSMDYNNSPASANFVTLRRTVTRATQELLHQEHLYQQQQLANTAAAAGGQQQHSSGHHNLALRALLKRPGSVGGDQQRIRTTLDEEADVRKEFTYEYVVTAGQQHLYNHSVPPPVPPSTGGGQQQTTESLSHLSHLQQQQQQQQLHQPPPPPKPCWPQPLAREKSSAVADLRARSESPSANRALAGSSCSTSSTAGETTPPTQRNKTRPAPPPKPSLHDMQMAYQLKLRNGLSVLMMNNSNHRQVQEEEEEEEEEDLAEDDRESLPESLAGFAASIISEEGGGGGGGNGRVEDLVSPIISECDWPHNTTATGESPAPLPDLMSLTSAMGHLSMSHHHQFQHHQQHSTENLYMNALVNASVEQDMASAAAVAVAYADQSMMEDTYLPMTSAKMLPNHRRSASGTSPLPPPLPAANRSCSPASRSASSNYYQPMQAQPQHPVPPGAPREFQHQLSFEENAYVEMTDNGRIKVSPRHASASSVFAGVMDPSYLVRSLPESPRYSEITDCCPNQQQQKQQQVKQEDQDQPHYEFIYKASCGNGGNEPVYMEVPQDATTPRDHEDECQEESNNKTLDSSSVLLDSSIMSSTTPSHHRRQSSLIDYSTANGGGSVNNDDTSLLQLELDLAIAPPRHPRFSISDTFRPASFFLQSGKKSMELPLTEQDEQQQQADGHESSDSELVSPPPIPSSAAARFAQHSRSQSLDYDAATSYTNAINNMRSQSRSSLISATSAAAAAPSPSASASDLSRRRPLTIVRSLEDLLVDASDDHLAALTTNHHHQPTASIGSGSGSRQRASTSSSIAFRGSTQSLASHGSPVWHQPLYENVSSGPVGAHHVRQASRVSSNASTRRMSSSPAAANVNTLQAEQQQQQYRQRIGSVHSLSSTMSNSSMCRSEQSTASGAPYYYSDLMSQKNSQTVAQSPVNNGGQQQQQEEVVVVLADSSSADNSLTGSLRSSRSAQAQAAKQAYQHSMDRLRQQQQQQQAQQRTVSPPTPTNWRGGGPQLPPPRQLTLKQQQQRAQTPDLLANHPEPTGNNSPFGHYQQQQQHRLLNGSSSETAMRRVRSLEGLLQDGSNDEQQQQQQQLQTMVTTETPRYTRDPTRNNRQSFGDVTSPNRFEASPIAAAAPFAKGTIEFSPWDEDQLWRDKLRRASIRHTRSMENVLDEIHQPPATAANNNTTDHRSNGQQRNKQQQVPAPVTIPSSSSVTDGDDCYERLIQYSATLERTKRGQSYLDGYMWDEIEQRFRQPNGGDPSSSSSSSPAKTVPSPQTKKIVASSSSPSNSSPTSSTSNATHPFLAEGLPSPGFEIDREKLRQWDLMSTAPVLVRGKANKEGGRRPVAAAAAATTATVTAATAAADSISAPVNKSSPPTPTSSSSLPVSSSTTNTSITTNTTTLTTSPSTAAAAAAVTTCSSSSSSGTISTTAAAANKANTPEQQLLDLAPPISSPQRQQQERNYQPVSSPVFQSSFGRHQQQQHHLNCSSSSINPPPPLPPHHHHPPPPPLQSVVATATSSTFSPVAVAGGTSPVQAAVVATTASVATSSMSSAAAHTSQMINGIKVAYHQSGFTAAGSRVTTSLVKSLQPAPSRPTPPPHHYHHHPSHNNMTQGGFNSSRGYNNDGVDDNNMMRPVKKGKLPLMIGHDQPSGGGGGVGDNGIGGCSRLASQDHNKVQLSAGDLLGRTHEELVLLLIQLRRQSSALVKARDACLLEMESQVKLASLDVNHRQECLVKTAELKHHVKELEKQLEKLKPLISLVDNMVKLGSSSSSTSTANMMRLMTSPALQHRQQPQHQQQQQQRINKSPETSTAVKRNLTPLLHQQQQIQKQLHHLQQQHSFMASPPTYSNVHPHHHQQQQQFHHQSPIQMNNNNNNTIVFHSTPLRGGGGGGGGMELPQGWEEAQISQLESKHHQLAQLEKFVREEGMAIEKLTRNQQVLRLAINGVRQQAAGAVNFADVEHCRQQQLFLERELGQIHSLLALSSKRLEDAAVEINRIEQEISVLHQQLHRVNAAAGRHGHAGHNSLNRSSSVAATAAGGREMVWLQAELDRVHQHVSQLQARRLELSSQVNRLTSSGDYLIDLDASTESWPLNNSFNQRKLSSSANNSTWCETDMDSLNTIDRTAAASPALYANTSMAPAVYHDHQHRGTYYHHQEQQEDQREEEDDEGMMLMDINEADERMKRYYGIPSMPTKQLQQQQQQQQSAADKEKAEIRTVRIVKRESEKRQRDKTSRRSPYDDMSGSFMDELTESGDEQPPPIPPPPSNGDYYNNGHDDPIMDDPVLSQFSHVLTLPRNSKRASIVSTSSQRNSLALSTSDIRQQSGRPLSMGPDQWRSSLRPRRNLASLTLSDRTASSSMSLDGQQTDEELLGSLDSTQRSPVLTPVYTSDAAREIVEEMRRQDQMSARRAVPRHKRRHITISCSQPLALEALSPQSKTQRVTQGRARDDVDLQRALRSLHHPFAPDVVRSTINQAIRINEKTIDKILSAPDKIVIPERYVPEQEVEEVGEEEKQRRLKKTESIRRMLTGHGAVTELPRPPSIAATNDIMELSTAEAKELLAKERQQRDHFISLNQMLVEEIKEKSKMAAAAQNMSMDNGQYVA